MVPSRGLSGGQDALTLNACSSQAWDERRQPRLLLPTHTFGKLPLLLPWSGCYVVDEWNMNLISILIHLP